MREVASTDASLDERELASVNQTSCTQRVDRSVVEVFINYKEAFTAWFRPRLRRGKELRIWPILDGEALDYEIDVWKLAADGVVKAGVWGSRGDSAVDLDEQEG